MIGAARQLPRRLQATPGMASSSIPNGSQDCHLSRNLSSEPVRFQCSSATSQSLAKRPAVTALLPALGACPRPDRPPVPGGCAAQSERRPLRAPCSTQGPPQPPLESQPKPAALAFKSRNSATQIEYRRTQKTKANESSQSACTSLCASGSSLRERNWVGFGSAQT